MKTDMRTWRVKIGIDTHWITEEEKDFYLEEVNHGKKAVILRDGKLILGPNIQEIAESEQLEADRKRDAGRWQCTFGKWHSSDECYCNVTYIQGKNNTLIPIRDDKPLLTEKND